MSEVMRAECDTQPWMEICSINLDWQSVECDLYDTKSPSTQEEDGGGLPAWIVYPVQFVAFLWELHIIVIVTFPWWIFLATVATVDWILDWVWLGLFGWWCMPCAGVFIWVMNLILLPFHIMAWLQRFRLETYGLLIDGWMLIFGFSGCYLRFGNDCLFDRTLSNRNMRTYWDMPLFFSDDKSESLSGKIASLVAFPVELET